MDSLRVDRWLAAARLFKSRTQATAACDRGKVTVNGVTVKPSHPVRIGDEVKRETPRGPLILDVLVLADRRLSPALARALYRDRSPPPKPRDDLEIILAPDRGNAEEKNRRALRRLRGK